MPVSAYNAIDNLKAQIKSEMTGGVKTSLSSGSAGLSGASYGTSSAPLRWVEDGVVKYAFVWDKHDFDDEFAVFI
jgi:hypothetical protein